MEGIVIRQYRKDDRDCVRNIAWDTAFAGESGSAFFSDKEILADSLTRYFTDYEPKSCFVAEKNGEVVGYLTGAKDTSVLKKVFIFKIVPALLIKVIINGSLLKKKNIIFILHSLIGLIKGEFRTPDFFTLYPATLHLNIKEGFRGLMLGSRLIAAYLSYLKKQKIRGVCLSTMSGKAGEFFARQGFNLLYSSPRSYFSHILHRDIMVYTYGKKIFLKNT